MKKTTTREYITPFQYKIPLEISQIIEITDPVYTFSEVMAHIDLRKYFAEEGCKMGRPRCDAVKMLKVIRFAFMEEGYDIFSPDAIFSDYTAVNYKCVVAH